MIRPHPRTVRVALFYLLAASVVVGCWALFLPRVFYDTFPGFGRVWIATDGPYNEHFVRDLGALNLALGLLAGLSLLRPKLASPFAVGLATLGYNLPHFIYHASMLRHYEPIDQVGNMVALGGALAASLVLLAARPAPDVDTAR